MSITYITSGTAVFTTSNPSPATPTHSVGDLLILTIGTKPDTTPATTPTGWTQIGAVSGGSGTVGIDTGPMRVGVWYRVADGTATDTTGSIVITGNNVSGAQVHVFRGTGAGYDIAGVGAADTTTGTAFSAVMPSDPGMTVGDMLLAIGVIPTDVGAGAQFTAETVAATGMTTVTLTEIGEWSSATGQDMGAWLARGSVVTGTSTAAPTVSSTASGTTTNVAGPIFLTRIREVAPPTAKSGTESPAITITESQSSLIKPSTGGGSPGIAAPWVGTVNPGNAGGSQSTSATVDVSGATDGTMVFIFGTLTDAQTSAITMPAGWTTNETSEGTSGGSSSRTFVAWKVKASTDTTISISWPVTARFQLVGMQWPGVDSTTPFENLVWAPHTGASTGTYVSGADAPTSTDRWAVVLASSRGSTAAVGWTPDAALTDRVNAIATVSPFNGLAVEDSNGTVSTSSTTYTLLGQTASHGQVGTLYLIPSATGSGGAGVNDTASISISETSSVLDVNTNTPISGTETTAISIAETSSVFVSISTTDTCAVTISESRNIDSSSTSTDTSAVSVAESRTLAGSSTSNDTSAISVSETSSVVISISTTDTSAVSIADVSSLFINATLSATDTAAISIADSSSSQSTLSRTDTSAVSVAETTAILTSVPAVDGAAISVADSSSLSISSAVTGVDGAAVSGAETSSVSVTQSASDTSAVSVSETRSILVAMSSTDTAAISVSEVSSISGTMASSDTAAVSVAETSGVGILNQISASDTSAISVAETASIAVAQSANDTSSISVVDLSVPNVSAPGTDGAAVSVVESASILVFLSRTDTSAISVADSSSTAQTQFVVAADTAAVSVADSSSPLVAVSRTDTSAISVSESVSIVVSLSRTDTSAISVSDVSSLTQNLALSASDSAAVSIAESRSIAGTMSSTDTSALSIADTSVTVLSISASDTSSISVAETSMVDQPSTQFKVYVSGAWKSADFMVFVGGVWKSATPKLRKAGNWQ